MSKRVLSMKEIERELARSGAVLVRHKSHHIWRLPSGRMVSLPATPHRGPRTYRNIVAQLRAMGVDLYDARES